ncbi:hypothetical protein MP638_003557 [Amoeboaphelidium occidentale]|nr:hypothetical protein MP638_003557 [Amoeboaphelidium occidentale]
MNEDVLTTATNISSIILNSSLMHIPQVYYDHNRGQIDHDHYDENYDMMEEDDQQQDEQEQNLGDNYKENMTPAHENMILHRDIVPVEIVRRRIVERQLQPTARSPLLPFGVSRSYQKPVQRMPFAELPVDDIMESHEEQDHDSDILLSPVSNEPFHEQEEEQSTPVLSNTPFAIDEDHTANHSNNITTLATPVPEVITETQDLVDKV